MKQCSAKCSSAGFKLLLIFLAGIVLFELFHRLVQQLGAADGGGGDSGGGVPTSPLAVLPLLGAEIAQVGLQRGMRRAARPAGRRAPAAG